MDNFVRFTGLQPALARNVLAPLKLATAVLLASGLAVDSLSIAGATLALAISAWYVARLLAPQRRAADGLVGFTLFGLIAAGLLVVRLLM
jgi:hypothetical protein